MIKKILVMGDPRLLRAAKAVEDHEFTELKTIVDDMYDTMMAEGGVGLAAPQIGVDLRLIMLNLEAPTVIINPWMGIHDEETNEDYEGCLSVPGLIGLVPRFTNIRYGGMIKNYCDRWEDFNQSFVDASGFHARVFQHEFDHLQGILYPRRITDLTKFGFVDTNVK